MKIQWRRLTLILAGIFAVTACSSGSGGTTSGSSTTRSITGQVASASAALVKSLNATSSCVADSIIATDTEANTQTATVADDCSFSIDLETGKSYSIAFLSGGSFIASLTFSTGTAGLTSSTLPLIGGTGDISLGTITITGSVAEPQNNPLSDTDTDDDGISDLDDDDDDGDGSLDDDEWDCDFDGVIDDYDDDGSSCPELEDGVVRVLEVKPRDSSDEEDELVDLDKKVKARVACVIDQSSVTSETFSVVSESGDPIACTFEFSDLSEAQGQIKCQHDSQTFDANTTYTATLDGLLCQDGSPIQSVSWSFSTETEDDDSGDYEDELDDAAEIELADDSAEDSADDSVDEADEADDSVDEADQADVV